MNDKLYTAEGGFIRLPHILKLIPVGKSTWWEGVRTGRFPQPVKLGPRTTAWRSKDISALIQSFSSNGRSSSNGGLDA